MIMIIIINRWYQQDILAPVFPSEYYGMWLKMGAGLVLSTKYSLFSSDTLEEKAGCPNCTSESWAPSEEVQEQQDENQGLFLELNWGAP